MFGRSDGADRVRRIAAINIEDDRLALAVGRARGPLLETLDFIEETPSAGLSGGMITDAELFSDALDRLAVTLERFADAHGIHRVVCGIHGPFVEIQYLTRSFRLPSGGPLAADEVREILHETALKAADQRVLLQVMPWRYLLDDYRETEQPAGLRGEQLTVEALGVFADPSPFADLQDVLDDVGLSGAELALTPLASSRVALTPEERSAGVVLIEFAWEECRVSYYAKRRLYLYRTMPRGLSALAEAISRHMPGTTQECRRRIPRLRVGANGADPMGVTGRRFLEGVLDEARRFLTEALAGAAEREPRTWVLCGLLADADGVPEVAARHVGARVRVPRTPDRLRIAGHDHSGACGLLGLLDSAAVEPGLAPDRWSTSRMRSFPGRLLRRLRRPRPVTPGVPEPPSGDRD